MLHKFVLKAVVPERNLSLVPSASRPGRNVLGIDSDNTRFGCSAHLGIRHKAEKVMVRPWSSHFHGKRSGCEFEMRGWKSLPFALVRRPLVLKITEF